MKQTKNPWLWFEFLFLVFVMSVHVFIACLPERSLLNWFTTDDAFYYFKVAQNIAAGNGVTFDGINVTNGFHPLWMLVCIPVFWLAQFDLLLPLRIIVVIAGLLSAGAGILLFRLLRRLVSPYIAAFIALLWTCSWTVYASIIENGLESGLSAFLIVLLVALVSGISERNALTWKQGSLIGLIAGLTVLARLDNIYLVMLLGVWFSLSRFTPHLRAVIVSDLGVIFSAALLSYFLRIGLGPQYTVNAVSLPWMVVLNFILAPVFLFLFGLYQPYSRNLSVNFLARLGAAVALAVLIGGGILLLLQNAGVYTALPRLVIVINGLLLFAGFFLIRLISRWTATGTVPATQPANLLEIMKADWKPFLRDVLVYFVPVVFLLGMYMLWSQWTVGIPMPVSGQVKQWWGSLFATVYGKPTGDVFSLLGLTDTGAWVLTVTVFRNVGMFLPSPIWDFIFLAALCLGAIFLIVKNRCWFGATLERLAFPAVIWGICAHILYYTSTGYLHMRPWYWPAEMIISMIVLALVMECLWKVCFPADRPQWAGIVVLAVLGLVSCLSFLDRIWTEFPAVTAGELHTYIADARGIEALTESGSIIGMTGSGANGYFISGRVIVNLDGLINSPAYFHALQAGEGAAFLNDMGMDYVYGSSYMLTETDPYQQFLTGRITPVESLGDNTLYRYTATP